MGLRDIRPAIDVLALLPADANVNHVDTQGATSLKMATWKKQIEVIRAVLTANADPRIVAFNSTALSGAT